MMNSFAHHPDLAQAFFGFNGHMLYGTTLSLRQRELLVLRVAAVRESQYLWAHHIVYQADAGLTDYEISAIAFGPGAPFLDPLDRALLRGVDELIRDGTISDDNWAVLAEKLTTQQILDVIFTSGATTSWLGRPTPFISILISNRRVTARPPRVATKKPGRTPPWAAQALARSFGLQADCAASSCARALLKPPAECGTRPVVSSHRALRAGSRLAQG